MMRQFRRQETESTSVGDKQPKSIDDQQDKVLLP
jgi:hypothetical protein